MTIIGIETVLFLRRVDWSDFGYVEYKHDTGCNWWDDVSWYEEVLIYPPKIHILFVYNKWRYI